MALYCFIATILTCCLPFAFAAEPEEMTSCHLWDRVPNVVSAGSTNLGTAGTYSCLNKCVLRATDRADSDTRCVGMDSINGDRTCYLHITRDHLALAQTAVSSGSSYQYRGRGQKLCPPYVKHSRKLAGCWLTTMVGYDSVQGLFIKKISGLTYESCATECVDELRCMFFVFNRNHLCVLYETSNIHLYRQLDGQIGFIENCDSILSENCGFTVKKGKKATSGTVFASVTTFEDCWTACDNRNGRCYGFDWTATTSECVILQANEYNVTTDSLVTEHYEYMCDCSAYTESETLLIDADTACPTVSTNFPTTSDGSCLTFMQNFSKRSVTLFDTPYLEGYDITGDACVFQGLQENAEAVHYDFNTVPLYNGLRCAMVKTVDDSWDRKLFNTVQWTFLDTICPTDFEAVSVSAPGVCGVKKWVGYAGQFQWASRSISNSNENDCLAACLADENIYGCEFETDLLRCLMYSHFSAGWFIIKDEANAIKWVIDRTSCC